MLRVHCDRLGRDVLIWSSSLMGIDNTSGKIVVTYVCGCGETAQMVTGSAVPSEMSRHVSV